MEQRGKMKNILVTGAEGFIGKNLITCTGIENYNLFLYDVNNSQEELKKFIKSSDFIIHLAGINRPKEETEFTLGNVNLTEEIVGLLLNYGKNIPILLSSSIQAEKDNPYGRSKRDAEIIVKNYGSKTGAPTYIFRFPNVFGKWCKPNYNSVIATWCYNTHNNLSLHIENPQTELLLVYIDDVVNSILNALNNKVVLDRNGYCTVSPTYNKKLLEIYEILQSFLQIRKKSVIPDFKDDFIKKLYATWTSYLKTDKFDYQLDIKRDNRGYLAEFIKSIYSGQIFVSKTLPGITRGNHWHHTKVEKFLVLTGQALIKLRKINDTDVIEYKVEGDELRVIDIPVGYTHSITNIGKCELITLFWANEIFNPDFTDTFFLEV